MIGNVLGGHVNAVFTIEIGVAWMLNIMVHNVYWFGIVVPLRVICVDICVRLSLFCPSVCGWLL